MKLFSTFGALFLWGVSAFASPSMAPVPYHVAAKLPDVLEVANPSQVQMRGFLGARVAASEKNRLLVVDEDDLLDAFERRHIKHHDWQGEHVGKFLHAATLAWVYTGDAQLKAKLERVVSRLVKTQEADGYLGTYPKAEHWTSWDVWSHKYNLIGLLTYYRFTGDARALTTCRRVGDLLVKTFPAQKSILAAGTHVGMAATSVLEPIVWLYRFTGEARYLDFARYIVRAYDEPNGPKVLSTLSTVKRVNETANGKAYEMLSNLVGVCELARVIGDRSLLQPVINAWQDIVENQLYITGTASHREHFGKPDDLPNEAGANVGETCVTVTWIQLNEQLLRLTGEARYADQLERSFLNHLAGAQRPDGSQWCYYTPLEGGKPYGNQTNCCLSSGPRGMSLAPELAYLKYFDGNTARIAHPGIAVNWFETSSFSTRIGNQNLRIEQVSDFPRVGRSTLTLHLQKTTVFGIKVRTPSWAQPLTLALPGLKTPIARAENGWTLVTPRRWKNGDRITIAFKLEAHSVDGQSSNAGRKALLWGPLVLAYDETRNRDAASFRAIATTESKAGQPPATLTAGESGAPLSFATRVLAGRNRELRTATMVPFAEAGSSGGRFAVWLRTPDNWPQNASLLFLGQQSRSRAGNVQGDITDGDKSTFVVTYDENGTPDFDWFAVSLDEPTPIRRVVFAHGHSFHDGGWFDASGEGANAFGKPQVQAQLVKNGPWQTLGTLDDYPVIQGTDGSTLKDGQEFTLRLAQPQKVVALRVIGKPAHGDGPPRRAFASAAELQAFDN